MTKIPISFQYSNGEEADVFNIISAESISIFLAINQSMLSDSVSYGLPHKLRFYFG